MKIFVALILGVFFASLARGSRRVHSATLLAACTIVAVMLYSHRFV
jgi:hypothetical protein